MEFFKLCRFYFEKIGLAIGNFITNIALTIFYFTFFAVFAVPFRLFADPFRRITKNSNWIIKKKIPEKLGDFKNE